MISKYTHSTQYISVCITMANVVDLMVYIVI